MFSNSGNVTHKERWLPLFQEAKETKTLLLSKQAIDSTTTTTTYNSLSIDKPEQSDDSCPPPNSSSVKKKLGLASLTVLIFYEVSGGPFGIEV